LHVTPFGHLENRTQRQQVAVLRPGDPSAKHLRNPLRRGGTNPDEDRTCGRVGSDSRRLTCTRTRLVPYSAHERGHSAGCRSNLPAGRALPMPWPFGDRWIGIGDRHCGLAVRCPNRGIFPICFEHRFADPYSAPVHRFSPTDGRYAQLMVSACRAIGQRLSKGGLCRRHLGGAHSGTLPLTNDVTNGNYFWVRIILGRSRHPIQTNQKNP